MKTDSITKGAQVVDLGLSVKWATCNLGASSEEEFGDYYDWGGTCIKSRYDDESYNWSQQPTLDINYDVAQQIKGDSWHIPNLREVSELYDKCEWEWTRKNGVKGYKLTSKVCGFTDKSIFLPAAGFIMDIKRINVGYAGYYWISSLYKYNIRNALASVFDRNIIIHCLPHARYQGLSIRPVCKKE